LAVTKIIVYALRLWLWLDHNIADPRQYQGHRLTITTFRITATSMAVVIKRGTVLLRPETNIIAATIEFGTEVAVVASGPLGDCSTKAYPSTANIPIGTRGAVVAWSTIGDSMAKVVRSWWQHGIFNDLLAGWVV